MLETCRQRAEVSVVFAHGGTAIGWHKTEHWRNAKEQCWGGKGSVVVGVVHAKDVVAKGQVVLSKHICEGRQTGSNLPFLILAIVWLFCLNLWVLDMFVGLDCTVRREAGILCLQVRGMHGLALLAHSPLSLEGGQASCTL
jgi:hypothetical protein